MDRFIKSNGFVYVTLTFLLIFFLNFCLAATESGIQQEYDKYSFHNEKDGNKSGFGIGVLINFVIALIVVLGVIYLIRFFLFHKTVSLEIGEEHINILAQKSIGPNKVIQIIEIADKVLIIGVGEKEITLLGEINDNEIINVIRFQASQRSGEKISSFRSYFEDILSKWNLLKDNKIRRDKDFIKNLKDRISKYYKDNEEDKKE